MPVRRRTQASARLAAQHVGAKRLATPSQALSTIAYTDRLSRSAPYADPPKHCSPGEKPLAVNVCTGVPLFGILGGVMCTWPKQPEVLR
jgi:hypothetical protein